MEKHNLYKRSLSLLGEEHLLVITGEEASELQKAISKYHRNLIKSNLGFEDKDLSLLEAIADEISDVEITTEQLKLAYNLSDKVEAYKQQKIERMEPRLDNYEVKRNYRLGGI